MKSDILHRVHIIRSQQTAMKNTKAGDVQQICEATEMKKKNHDAIIKLRYEVWQSNYADFEDEGTRKNIETLGGKVDFDN